MGHLRLRGRTGALVAAAAAGLVLAGAAFADREQIRLTKAGKTAARAAVVKRADLGPAPGWTGGATKPDLSGVPPCAGFRPKQSDLVLNGAAETHWKHAGLDIVTEAQVLATPAMVRLDWQRTVLSPRVLPCLRSALKGQLGTSERLVSMRWVTFPRLATYTRAVRAVLSVGTGSTSVPVLVDIVLVGRDRTEVTLTVTAPLAGARVVKGAEERLGRILVSRIRA